MEGLVAFASQPYVLFLELDFYINPEWGEALIKKELFRSYNVLKSNQADVYYLRNRKNPGWPNWAEMSMGSKEKEQRHIALGKGATHVCYFHFWVKDPVATYPNHFHHCVPGEENLDIVCGPSMYCMFTNNPYMTSKTFFNSKILPALKEINISNNTNYYLVEPFFLDRREYWLDLNYTLAQGTGVFEHNNKKVR